MNRQWPSTIVALFVLLCSSSPLPAQEKLRLAWAGFSPTNSPIWVIEDRKLMQKMGVQPEIIAISASPTVLQALLPMRSMRRASRSRRLRAPAWPGLTR